MPDRAVFSDMLTAKPQALLRPLHTSSTPFPLPCHSLPLPLPEPAARRTRDSVAVCACSPHPLTPILHPSRPHSLRAPELKQ